MKIFDIDGPLMRALTVIADLLWLNVLALVCCIPIITTGASLTALHYMVLKMVRGEENRLTASFFKAFKENFKQSTLIWLILLVITAVLGFDLYVIYFQLLPLPKALNIIIVMVAVLVLFMMTWVFPVQAKFANPVPRTIKNAWVISMLQFPRTILMIAVNLSPCLLLFSANLLIRMLPVVLFFGLALPAYIGALLYNKFFKKLEARIEAADETGEETGAEREEEEDERIFRDELDESISINENLH